MASSSHIPRDEIEALNRNQPSILELFARLYDVLDRNSIFLIPQESGYEYLEQKKLEVCSYEILNNIYGDVVPKYVTNLIDNTISQRLLVQASELLLVAKAIDNCFAELSLDKIFFSRSPYTQIWRDKYYDNGYFLCCDCGGFVLPKGVETARGQRLSKEFQNLARVYAPESIAVNFHRLFSLTSEPNDSLRIAIDPFIKSKDEIEFHKIDANEQQYYQVRPNPKALPMLEDRLKEHLVEMISNKVQVAIFPELIFSSELVEKASEFLGSRGIGESSLDLVFCGTYFYSKANHSELNPNSCSVLRKDGDLIFYQNKLHRYLMSQEEQQTSGADAILGGNDIEEAASTFPRALNVLDTPAGRFCVLICEDFARSIPADEFVTNLGVSHLIVPVMDGAGDWTLRQGIRRANEPGAASLVANSITLLPTAKSDTSVVVHPDRHAPYKCVRGTNHPFKTGGKNPFTMIDLKCVFSHHREL